MDPFSLHLWCNNVSWDISWGHTEPSLLLWAIQGSSQFLPHPLALDPGSLWIPSTPGYVSFGKIVFRAKIVTRSLSCGKAVAVWGWLWCWAHSGCRDELLIPWVAGIWSCGWKESMAQGCVWAVPNQTSAFSLLLLLGSNSGVPEQVYKSLKYLRCLSVLLLCLGSLDPS